MKQNNKHAKPKFTDYVQAFLDYLRRPKTVFDLQDRAKAAVLIGLIIMAVQFLIARYVD